MARLSYWSPKYNGNSGDISGLKNAKLTHMISMCYISDGAVSATGASGAGDNGASAAESSELYRRHFGFLLFEHTTPRDSGSTIPASSGIRRGSVYDVVSRPWRRSTGFARCDSSGLRPGSNQLRQYMLSGRRFRDQLPTTNDKPRRNLRAWRLVYRWRKRYNIVQ